MWGVGSEPLSPQQAQKQNPDNAKFMPLKKSLYSSRIAHQALLNLKEKKTYWDPPIDEKTKGQPGQMISQQFKFV